MCLTSNKYVITNRKHLNYFFCRITAIQINSFPSFIDSIFKHVKKDSSPKSVKIPRTRRKRGTQGEPHQANIDYAVVKFNGTVSEVAVHLRPTQSEMGSFHHLPGDLPKLLGPIFAGFYPRPGQPPSNSDNKRISRFLIHV